MTTMKEAGATQDRPVRWLSAGGCVLMAVAALAFIGWSLPLVVAASAALWVVSAALLVVKWLIPAGAQPRPLAHPRWFVLIGGGISAALFWQSGVAFAQARDFFQMHSAAQEGIAWMISGGLALIATLIHAEGRALTRENDAQNPPMPPAKPRPRYVPLAVGVGLIGIVTEINAGVLGIQQLNRVSSHLQFAILIAGIGLVGFGLAGRRIIAQPATDDSDDANDDEVDAPPLNPNIDLVNWPRWEWLALAAILALAFIWRVYDLREAQRFLVDEIHFLTPIIFFWGNPNIAILTPFSSIAAFPYIFPYLQWLSVEAVGHNLEGLRFVAVVFGVLNVWAVYLLARVLFGVRVALIAAVLLAALPVHLQFSRIGLNNIADPFFGTMAAYFVVRAWRYPHRAVGNFAWAGVMVGLTQYWYEGGRFLFPALIVGLMIVAGLMALPSTWRERRFGHYARAVAMFAAGAVIVSAPIYITLISIDRPLAQRMESAGLREETTIQLNSPLDFINHASQRLSQSFLIHVAIPEEALYYGGDDPLLPRYVVPFFVSGMFYALWLATVTGAFYRATRRRALMQIGAVLLLAWVFATWGGNIFMARSRISARYVVEFPALAILVALGIDVLVGAVVGWWRRGRQVVLIALLTALTVMQVTYFFGPYQERFNVQSRQEQSGRSYDVDDAIFRAVPLLDMTTVHIVDHVPFLLSDLNNMLRFYRGDRQRQTVNVVVIDPVMFDSIYLQSVDITRPHAFFIPPESPEMVDALREAFDEVAGPFVTAHTPSQVMQMELYYVPSYSGN